MQNTKKYPIDLASLKFLFASYVQAAAPGVLSAPQQEARLPYTHTAMLTVSAPHQFTHTKYSFEHHLLQIGTPLPHSLRSCVQRRLKYPVTNGCN